MNGGFTIQAAERKALLATIGLAAAGYPRRPEAARQCNTANNVLQVFSNVCAIRSYQGQMLARLSAGEGSFR